MAQCQNQKIFPICWEFTNQFPTHKSATIYQQQYIFHSKIMQLFQLLNVKNMKCTLPSPEIRPIIVGGAPLHVLSAPNKPHQGISSAQYFPHHQSSTYFEPGNED